jgi:hypothetical protein
MGAAGRSAVRLEKRSSDWLRESVQILPSLTSIGPVAMWKPDQGELPELSALSERKLAI